MTAELRRLLAEATPGPWTALIDDYERGSLFITADPIESQADLASGMALADAALIVAAVNALPALLDRLDALEAVAAAALTWARADEPVSAEMIFTQQELELRHAIADLEAPHA